MEDKTKKTVITVTTPDGEENTVECEAAIVGVIVKRGTHATESGVLLCGHLNSHNSILLKEGVLPNMESGLDKHLKSIKPAEMLECILEAMANMRQNECSCEEVDDEGGLSGVDGYEAYSVIDMKGFMKGMFS